MNGDGCKYKEILHSLFDVAFPISRYTEHVTPEFYAKYKILRLESTRKRYGVEKELEKLNGQQVYDLIRKGREVGVTHAQLAHIVNRKESSIGGIVTKLRKRGVWSGSRLVGSSYLLE